MVIVLSDPIWSFLGRYDQNIYEGVDADKIMLGTKMQMILNMVYDSWLFLKASQTFESLRPNRSV